MDAYKEIKDVVIRLLRAGIITREEAERILRPEDLSEADEE
ncbi:MAG: hypothetical protein RXQ62_07235 [Nitrososphaeria archaeon]